MPQPTMPASVRIEQYWPLFQRLLTPMAVPLANFSSRLTVRGMASLTVTGPGIVFNSLNLVGTRVSKRPRPEAVHRWSTGRRRGSRDDRGCRARPERVLPLGSSDGFDRP